MRRLEAIVTDVAATNIPILILGESGTGKQILARHIHEMSLRREMPILQIACAALTADRTTKQLRLNSDAPSSIGTMVLDEVSEFDRDSQRKLLHMLPDGENFSERLSARIISTSSQNLEHEVRAGRFRNDLYHRLNGFCIRIPPLRERREDIPLLFNFFLSKHSTRMGKLCTDVSSSGMTRLVQHSWSGNVRELENVAIKVLALGDEAVALADLSMRTAATQDGLPGPGRSLKAAARAASREAERELILKALARTQ